MILISCGDVSLPPIERENLFDLTIGRMEDQIDLFSLETRESVLKSRIVMKDGIFYLSDTHGAKVTRFTSYGDLLSMVYNPETNPTPLNLSDIDSDGTLLTRKAVAYPLNEPGSIAVDSRNNLYVEDRLPTDRRIYDTERRMLFDRIVLRFSADGQVKDYLGQEGVGGTPFTNIVEISISAEDDPVVICRISGGWDVFWFDADGNLLFIIKIEEADLPKVEGKNALVSLDSIKVAPDKKNLYVKVDYYNDTIDASTNTRAGIGHDASIVWIMDIATGEFVKHVDIPLFEAFETQNGRRSSSERIYSFLGVARDGKLFFFSPDSGGYSIFMLELSSNVRKRGFIRVDDNELIYNTFHISGNGILSALLVSEFEASFVWWRTDRLIGEPRA